MAKPSQDETRAKFDAITEVAFRHEDEIEKVKGFKKLAVGYKRTEGKTTEEMAIIVIVEKKLPETQLLPEEAVPKTYEGIPTDVDVEKFTCSEHTEQPHTSTDEYVIIEDHYSRHKTRILKDKAEDYLK